MALWLQTRYYSENAIFADFPLQTLHYSIYRDLSTSDFLNTLLFLLRLQTKSTLVRCVLSPAKESCWDLCNGPKFKIWMLDLGKDSWNSGPTQNLKRWVQNLKRRVQNLKKWVQTWKNGSKTWKNGSKFLIFPPAKADYLSQKWPRKKPGFTFSGQPCMNL